MPYVDQKFYKQHEDELRAFVQSMTRYFLKTEASTGKVYGDDVGILLTNSNATPVKMEPLLVKLRGLTDTLTVAVLHRAQDATFDFGEWGPGIVDDWKHWRERLEVYEDELEAAKERNPNASGLDDFRFWNRVTRPLLLGIYPGEEHQRVLDAVTPFVITHQLDVGQRTMVEAEQEMIDYFKEKADEALDLGGDILTALAVAVGLGIVAYGAAKGLK